MDVPDGTKSRTLLEITFGQHALNADANEGPDHQTGYALADWDDWLAEFDRQQLAVRVRDEEPGLIDNDFEFVARDSGVRERSGGARQPRAATVETGKARRGAGR
jgi:hypothetical protein